MGERCACGWSERSPPCPGAGSGTAASRSGGGGGGQYLARGPMPGSSDRPMRRRWWPRSMICSAGAGQRWSSMRGGPSTTCSAGSARCSTEHRADAVRRVCMITASGGPGDQSSGVRCRTGMVRSVVVSYLPKAGPDERPPAMPRHGPPPPAAPPGRDAGSRPPRHGRCRDELRRCGTSWGAGGATGRSNHPPAAVALVEPDHRMGALLTGACPDGVR